MATTTQTNKIKYGISMMYYAPITAESDDGTITYGTPVPIPGAISISLSSQGERRSLYADNVEYFTAWGNGGYEGDVNVAMIPDQFRKDCLGEKQDTTENSSVTFETTDLITNRFALLFQFDGDYKNIRVALYNCTASRPDIASQTVEEGGVDPSQSTETFTVSAAGRRSDHICRAKLVDDGSDTYKNWFTSVYVPKAA